MHEQVPSRHRSHAWLINTVLLLTLSVGSVDRTCGFLSSQPPTLSCRKLDTIQKGLVQSTQQAVQRQDDIISEPWLPPDIIPTDGNLDNDDTWREDVEAKALILAADLIRNRLDSDREESDASVSSSPSPLIEGKFVDLCCTRDGERTLEGLFEQKVVEGVEPSVVLGAIACFHSLLIMGLNYGLSGTPEQVYKWTAHLREPEDDDSAGRDFMNWDMDSTRRLKVTGDRSAALRLLALTMRKQSPQGAFDLLVSLGVWNKHEDLVLLRSGFPIRFSDDENNAADELLNDHNSGLNDPDSLLGIRKDFRSMKVITIDSASTSEIDDGVACEEYTTQDGSIRRRYWVHIADADHIAKRDTLSFRGAKRRVTSHYLPEITIPMFPSRYVLSVRNICSELPCIVHH